MISTRMRNIISDSQRSYPELWQNKTAELVKTLIASMMKLFTPDIPLDKKLVLINSLQEAIRDIRIRFGAKKGLLDAEQLFSLAKQRYELQQSTEDELQKAERHSVNIKKLYDTFAMQYSTIFSSALANLTSFTNEESVIATRGMEIFGQFMVDISQYPTATNVAEGLNQTLQLFLEMLKGNTLTRKYLLARICLELIEQELIHIPINERRSRGSSYPVNFLYENALAAPGEFLIKNKEYVPKATFALDHIELLREPELGTRNPFLRKTIQDFEENLQKFKGELAGNDTLGTLLLKGATILLEAGLTYDDLTLAQKYRQEGAKILAETEQAAFYFSPNSPWVRAKTTFEKLSNEVTERSRPKPEQPPKLPPREKTERLRRPKPPFGAEENSVTQALDNLTQKISDLTIAIY
jgi:hypothetical protein